MTRSRVVKVRVTEAEYCDWVQQAAEASVSLSEAIRRAMEPGSRSGVVKPSESLTEGERLGNEIQGLYSAARQDVVYEHIPDRRWEPCSHSRPAYAFCPECDGK